ncbi:MAG: type II secretion system F family protein [Planctomycetota bacterium]
MAQYAFVARDRDGRTRTGTRESASEATLLGELRAGGLLPLSIRAPASARDGRRLRPSVLERLFPPRPVDVEVGLQQIAYMLRSGLSLLQSLEIAAAQSSRRSMARTWSSVADQIQSGGNFHDGLARERCIPHLVVTLAAVGERTGDLDASLDRAATAMERRRELRTNLATALAYPAIVVVLTVSVVTFMMSSLVPKLSRFLTAFGRRLPPITQLLVDISAFVERWLVVGLVMLACASVALVLLWLWPPGRLVIDRTLLRVPLVGRALRLAATTAFARNMSALLTSGVRLTEALQVVEPVLPNRHIARQVGLARQRVVQGAGFAEPLAASGAFSPMLAHMVAVGESSGTLDEVLEHMAEFHDSRLQALIRRFGTLIEPVIVIVLGTIVGFVYLAFFVAIYAIAGGRA